MASEPQALMLRPETVDEGDYRSLCAALEASARGRAFLNEYARRNRNADTEIVLGALERIEARMHAGATGGEQLRAELRMLLIAIRLARPDIDAGSGPGKVEMLTALVDLLERRIDGMVEGGPVDAGTAPGQPAEIARPQLSVVPPPDEPELPIPSPVTAQPPAIAVVPAPPKPSAAIMPEVNVFDSAAPAPAATSKAPAKPAAERPEPPAADRLRPLAAIMALSEAERLALFT